MTAITITFPKEDKIISYLESDHETRHFYRFHKDFIHTIAETFAETTGTSKNIKEAVLSVTKRYNSGWKEADLPYVTNTIATALEACAKANCQIRAEAACSKGNPRIISKL